MAISGRRDAKLDAIRAVLRRSGRPLTLRELHERVENRLKQVVGRARLYKLLGVIACTTREIVATGRGSERAYALGRGRK